MADDVPLFSLFDAIMARGAQVPLASLTASTREPIDWTQMQLPSDVGFDQQGKPMRVSGPDVMRMAPFIDRLAEGAVNTLKNPLGFLSPNNGYAGPPLEEIESMPMAGMPLVRSANMRSRSGRPIGTGTEPLSIRDIRHDVHHIWENGSADPVKSFSSEDAARRYIAGEVKNYGTDPVEYQLIPSKR